MNPFAKCFINNYREKESKRDERETCLKLRECESRKIYKAKYLQIQQHFKKERERELEAKENIQLLVQNLTRQKKNIQQIKKKKIFLLHKKKN